MAAREDPGASQWFYLDLQNNVSGMFRECSGIGSETEVIEQKVVGKGGKPVIIKIPGAVKWENVVLKRGVTKDMQIWDWRKIVEDGDTDKARSNGTVQMMNKKGDVVAEWTLENAWPTKVTGPVFNASSNDVAVEELHICHEGMFRVKV